MWCVFLFSLNCHSQEHWNTQRGCELNLSSLCTLPLSVFHSLSVLLSLTCGQGVSEPHVLPSVLPQTYLFMVSANWQTQVVCMKLWCPLAPHVCIKITWDCQTRDGEPKAVLPVHLGQYPPNPRFHLTYSFVMKFGPAEMRERVQYQNKCSVEATTHNRP